MRPGFLGLEIIMSKLQDRIKIKFLFPVLELNFGTQFPTNFVNSPKDLLKNIFITYCSLQWKQDYYVEAPILLQKVAKSAPTT